MRRWLTIGVTLLTVAGCDVAPDELSGLSPEGAQAYVVLRDQLEQMPDQLSGWNPQRATVCVSTPSGTDNVTMVERLRKHVAAGLDVALTPDSACILTGESPKGPNGEPAVVLFASGESGIVLSDWSAGYSFGEDTGGGNAYELVTILGYPFVIRGGEILY